MDTFNVPSMLAESSSTNYATEATSNLHHLQQQQQPHQTLLLPHHHKDQMLAAGSTPMLPFYSHLQMQPKDTGTTGAPTAAATPAAATSAAADNFSTLQAIDASQLDGGISLSGLCERFFVASPNPHSNSNNMTLMGTAAAAATTTATATTTTNINNNTNNNNNNITSNNNNVEAKAVRASNSVIIESVTMPSFANILFPNHRTNHTSNECIDPALLQKNPQNNNNNTNNNSTTLIVPAVEYHQLKPLEVVNSSATSGSVSTSNFLSSTTAQLLDFEVQVGKDDSHIISTTTTTSAGSGSGTGTGATSTTITANPTRSSLHSIEELAASSCVPKVTSPNNSNNSSSASTTPQQQHLHQQQQQQQHHMQSGNNSGSNLSTDDESMSEDEFGLEIDDNGGYQDTTSSHSQQSAGGGGGGGGGGNGGNLLNGSSGGSSVGGGYMLLPQAASSSGNNNNNTGGHMSSGSVGNGGNGGGGNGAGGNSGGPGNSMGGTSATPGHGGEVIDFKHLFEELCPVCGDKVSGYHYGLLTCESCKGFFKRTVQNKKVYTCVAERSCHIDKTQRKRCPYCRFQKCLEVGMKLEAVRADRMRGGRNKFGPMYKRDRARKLQVMRQRQLALQALRNSMGPDIKPTPISPGYQQAYPNMNIKQEIQIPQVSSLTQSPDSSPSPIAIALGQVNASTGGVITTPMNAGNGGSGGGGGGNGGGLNGPSSVGNGNSSNGSSSSTGGGNNNGSSTGNGASGGGGAGGGGGGGGGNNAGGGGGGSGNNSGDGLHRNSGHEAGIGSLQNTADSKLCFDSGTHPSSTADALIEPLRVSPMIREFVQSIDDREWQTQLFALLQKQTYNQVEVDLFELMCKVLDQNLFSQVDWARNTVFFKDLKVDDQMKLLQHSWSDMLVLDHLHHRIHNGLPDETQLNNGQVFNLLSLGLLGVPQLGDYFNELQNKLQDLKFDMGDYVCMKFLILLNPNVRGIVNRKTVSEGHDNVQAALLDYTLTCYPSVNDKFSRLVNILPEIHAMAARGEEHLYSKHCAGSAPTQTLLMEMLHAKRKV
ncbi:hypothetical protein KR038_006502 [Drosophila bunnanda]|nr:hypothetical protein KR038_006502 [Drosophila bunnanda]